MRGAIKETLVALVIVFLIVIYLVTALDSHTNSAH